MRSTPRVPASRPLPLLLPCCRGGGKGGRSRRQPRCWSSVRSADMLPASTRERDALMELRESRASIASAIPLKRSAAEQLLLLLLLPRVSDGTMEGAGGTACCSAACFALWVCSVRAVAFIEHEQSVRTATPLMPQRPLRWPLQWNAPRQPRATHIVSGDSQPNVSCSVHESLACTFPMSVTLQALASCILWSYRSIFQHDAQTWAIQDAAEVRRVLISHATCHVAATIFYSETFKCFSFAILLAGW